MRVGIDLGTTFSTIAHVTAHGVPALFPDFGDANAFRTPSVVHVGPAGHLVGQSVEDLLEEDSALPVARFAKLALGREPTVFADHLGRGWSPEAICALILLKLRRDAESFSDESIDSAVVTVPAQFGDAQRRAVKRAAALAGITVSSLLEEPVAAAIHCGLAESTREQTLFVYDLGGGTFDATVLQRTTDGLAVLATSGVDDLGGKRFDELLVDMFADQFQLQHGFDPRGEPAAVQQLRRIAEQIKIKLSAPGRGEVRRSILLLGKPLELIVTRSQFDHLIGPLLDRSIESCQRCLAEAQLGWDRIDRILLVGGSSLLPAVQRRIALASDRPAERIITHQPHQAVVCGAAAVAARKAGTKGALQSLQCVANADLGLRVWDRQLNRPAMQVLIRRNLRLPAQETATFYTTRPDQTRVMLEVVQSKGAGEVIESLGHFAFGPIAAPAKNYPVEVSLAYDVEGLVTVSASDPKTGRAMEVTLEPSGVTSADLKQQRQLLTGVRVNE